MHNKIIVIEGPDGAGKSTLALALADHFQWPIVHGGGPLLSRSEFQRRREQKNWHSEGPMICDRISYISELVYAGVDNRKPFTSKLELDYYIVKINPIIIFCSLESSKEMVERILMVPKPHKTAEFIEKVKKDHPEITRRYCEVMRNIYPPVLNFNWKYDRIENLISQITHKVT